MADKHATPDHPIHDLIASRWSPYVFADRPVSDADLCSMLEAARWAASSYNEQPSSYIVAKREHADEFQRLLSCLVELNQAWAKAAAVLALGVVRLRFTRNDQPNRAAVHDLGLASANLVVEATSRGLAVHQMIGIVPEKAREVYAIPEAFEAWTGLAIGYRGDPTTAPDTRRARDTSPRQRKPLSDFVFTGHWGSPSPIVSR